MIAKRSFQITGRVFDSDIEHNVELVSDEAYAVAFVEGYIEALYPSKLCDFEISAPDLHGDVWEYEVHVWRR